jgi:hypothetical protein
MAGGWSSDVGYAYVNRPSGDGTSWQVLIDNYDWPINGSGNGYVVCTHA